MSRRILFLTGTRADFGKLKPLIRATSTDPELDYLIVATGMHLDSKYGHTEYEISKSGFTNITSFSNSGSDSSMDLTLARTISGLSTVLRVYKPDLLVIHGDRIEALAGAITGTLNNVRVAHVEGGEFSGTVDEHLRHSITKLAHVHYVANESARDVVLQLGEHEDTIWIIGSPEIDVMLSDELPDLDEVLTYYQIPFREFALLAFHPVTTELSAMAEQAKSLVEAVQESSDNYIVVYPNNDHGSEIILSELLKLSANPRIRIIPSIRFEAFQSLLKNAQYIIGNSSSGVREAHVHGTPAINLGSRQSRRNQHRLILESAADKASVLAAMQKVRTVKREPTLTFGHGQSASKFLDSMRSERLWDTPIQKVFVQR
jgi:UDP-N-acetylglucosamine 2-epimerase (hydrolysing)